MTFASPQMLSIWASPSRWPAWATRLVFSILPSTVTVVLVIFVAYSLAQFTWTMIESPRQAAAPTGSGPVRTATVQRQAQADLGHLSELHLFGSAAEATTAPVASVAAPDTTLNLTLHGVFVEPDPKQGAAIIGKAGGQQSYYKAGDSLPGGVKLVEVWPEYVILLRDGHYEKLRFPETPKLSVPTTSARSAGNGLASYRREFMNQPQKILDYLQIYPLTQGNTITGYRVLPQQGKQAFFRQLGLQVGDIVTAVNGIPVSDRSQAANIMSQLTHANRLVLDVMRRGSATSVVINLR